MPTTNVALLRLVTISGFKLATRAQLLSILDIFSVWDDILYSISHIQRTYTDNAKCFLKGNSGIIVVRTATLMIVGMYSSEMSPSVCVEAVERLGR